MKYFLFFLFLLFSILTLGQRTDMSFKDIDSLRKYYLKNGNYIESELIINNGRFKNAKYPSYEIKLDSFFVYSSRNFSDSDQPLFQYNGFAIENFDEIVFFKITDSSLIFESSVEKIVVFDKTKSQIKFVLHFIRGNYFGYSVFKYCEQNELTEYFSPNNLDIKIDLSKLSISDFKNINIEKLLLKISTGYFFERKYNPYFLLTKYIR